MRTTVATGTVRPRVPDTWQAPAVVGLVLAALFAVLLLARAGGDASLLVHAAPPWADPATAPSSLTVQAPEDGFDGQFFYRIAIAPWSEATTVDGLTFDLPTLRNARWGYGAMGFVASAGRDELVPWALIVINVLAAGAVGALGGRLAQTSGRHALWGALFVLWPGFAYSLSLDTSELLASSFVLAGMLAARGGRWQVTALALSAAVLTRDTTAVVPAGFAAAGAWSCWRATSGPARAAAARGLAGGVVPLVVFVLWQTVQRARFGEWPLASSRDNNLAGPFFGLADQLGDLLPPSGGEAAFRLVSAMLLLSVLVLAAWSIGRSRAPLGEKVAWLAAVGVVALLNDYLWSGATAFMRAGTEAGILAIAIVLGSRQQLPARLAAVGLAGTWLLTAVAQTGKLA